MAEKNWYALYVKSRSEKKVATEFDANGVEYYLPTIKILRKWSDRKKLVDEPLFRGYIFVYIDQREYFDVVQTPNVVKYVSFEGKAVVVRPQEIEAIKYYLSGADPENIENQKWEAGRKIEVIAGSMAGLTGELIEVRGKKRVKVELKFVDKNLIIMIPKNRIRFLPDYLA